MAPIQHRYDFTLLFDVRFGSPNSDPGSGLPRLDPETRHGFTTDGSLKRAVRDYVALAKGGEKGYGIYISRGKTLNQVDLEIIESADFEVAEKTQAGLKKKLEEMRNDDPAKAKKLVEEIACANLFDVRTFGAVMTSYAAVGATQIRGPVQMGFAYSIDPITIQSTGITRCVRTKEGEDKIQGPMAYKHVIPYALYRVDGYVSAATAEKYAGEINPGFSDADLELFWDALLNMFEHNHSAGRGNMSSRKLVIFEHDSKMGNIQADKLFETLHISRKPGVDYPRRYTDYEVTLDMDSIPDGVTVEIRE